MEEWVSRRGKGSRSAEDSASDGVAERVGAAAGQGTRGDAGEVAAVEPGAEAMAPGEQALREHLARAEASGEQAEDDRRGLVATVLRARLQGVAPHGPDRRPVERPLAPLREGDRLALVVRARVAQQELRQVGREQGVARGAARPRRGGAMADVAIREPGQGPRVGLVLVGGDLCPRPGWDDASHELLHSLARGLGVGPPVGGLELAAPHPLGRSQGAATAKLRVAEAVDVVRGADQEVELEGPVLAVLEGPQAVEHERLARGGVPRPQPLEEEQAVASEALALALDAAVGETELAGDLAQRRAAYQPMKERREQARVLQPVGGAEGL